MTKDTKTMTNKSHDDILRQKAGCTMKTMVARILRYWDRASQTNVAEGTAWYPEARIIAGDLAIAAGIDIETAAAVISHLSPQTRWAQNVAGAYALVLKGDTRGLLGRNVAGARRALEAPDGPSAIATLSGQKTTRFAANILGDFEQVTVDVWACKVAGIDDRVLQRKGVYDAVERAFQIAARKAGVDPAILQAVTWVVARTGRAR